MTTPTFRPITADDAQDVIAMMASLYREDPSMHVSTAHFRHTVSFLLRHPERGRIIVFDLPDAPCIGYAILIPYWSNEFGGSVVEVDEVFVTPHARSSGIGAKFFRWIEDERPFGAIAIELEVTPDNHRAEAFYRRIGFEARTNRLQVRRIAPGPTDDD